MMLQAMTSKDSSGKQSNTELAKQLLAKYGSAYLVTSISFAIVSFAACYFAVDAGAWWACLAARGYQKRSWQHVSRPLAARPIGVDVASLLGRVGLNVSDTSEKVRWVELRM
jgi:hypothetical protein